jgi:hypothetical protein
MEKGETPVQIRLFNLTHFEERGTAWILVYHGDADFTSTNNRFGENSVILTRNRFLGGRLAIDI